MALCQGFFADFADAEIRDDFFCQGHQLVWVGLVINFFSRSNRLGQADGTVKMFTEKFAQLSEASLFAASATET